jgi:hypothetical protein
MKLRSLLLAAMAMGSVLQNAYAQMNYEGPVPQPQMEYGMTGVHPVQEEWVSVAPDADWECFDTVKCLLFSPKDLTGPLPTVFYFPGGTEGESDLSDFWTSVHLFGEMIASHGYNLVCPQYQQNAGNTKSGSNNYGCSYLMTQKMQNEFASRIDTTRVGIHGYLTGSSIALWMSVKRYINSNWGENGRFLWSDVQGPIVGLNNNWPDDLYAVQSNEVLESMPDDVIYVSSAGDWAHYYDPLISIDFFEHIGVPDSNKAFLFYQSDTIAHADTGYIYYACDLTHSVFNAVPYGVYDWAYQHNAQDYYFSMRTLHALCEWTWNRDRNARGYCLGNEETGLILNGELKPTLAQDDPDHTQFNVYKKINSQINFYWVPGKVSWNMRQYTDPDWWNTYLSVSDIPSMIGKAYPNPSVAGQWIQWDSDEEIASAQAFTLSGQRLELEWKSKAIRLPEAGMYRITVQGKSGRVCTWNQWVQ